MNFTLHQLQVFYAVSELQSVTKAAEHLHLTQPAVSIQLKNFQDQFTIPLFETVGRQLYITDFGKEVAANVKVILEQVQSFNKISLNYKGELTGSLKIAVVSTGKYVMPFFLTDFLQKFPQVDVKIDVSNRSKVLESIANNEIDFALVSLDPTKLACEKLDLIENKLVVVGHPKFIAENPKLNTLKELIKRVPLIYREEGSGTRLTMERFLERKQLHATKKIELTSNEAVKQAIVAGMGISIMPLIGLRNELKEKEVHIFHTAGLPIKTTWKLVWPKGKKFSPAAQAYHDFICKEKPQVIKKYFHWYEEAH